MSGRHRAPEPPTYGAAWVRPFFRCDCGKIHTSSGVTIISRCTCGAALNEVMWRKS